MGTPPRRTTCTINLGASPPITQTADGVPYVFSYSYNGSNNLTGITYPSGRQEVVTYDTAGRVGQVATNGVANAGSVLYAAHGGVASFQLGNGLHETTNYNSLMQVQQISLGSQAQTTGLGVPAASEDQWWLSNTYSSTNNNGNVLQQTIGLPGSIQISEAYSYDKANRLLVAAEQSSSPSNPVCPDSIARYVEGFQYDVWGNRTVNCLVGLGPSTLAPSSFDSNTNKISPGNGWTYDSVGNITQEPSASGYRMYLYDSENRQITFCTQDPGGCVNAPAAGRTQYVYDGDGKRVKKLDSTGATVYVYDIQGNLAAEYSTETAAAGSATGYLTADHLGTTRVVTSATGTVVARRDYRPFGEEIVPSAGDPRLNVAGYSTDPGTTVKFTGKERGDPATEGGLDYFGARYFSAAEGRFMSPDPVNASAHYVNPQSWNAYSYADNRPLSLIDPDGFEPVKAQAGTIQGFVQNMNTTPHSVGLATGAAAGTALSNFGETKNLLPTNTGVFNMSPNRYVYTANGGWIDMVHFVFYAGRAYKYKLAGKANPVGKAVQDGYWQEFADTFRDDWSAYSYEDLPSDRFGAEFGAEFFDPTSSLTLAEQVQSFISYLRPMAPARAPNYTSLPLNDSKNPPMARNTTTNPMFTLWWSQWMLERELTPVVTSTIHYYGATNERCRGNCRCACQDSPESF